MNPTLIAAVMAAIVAVVGSLYTFLGKKGETRVVDDANLRDDQREFIAVLRKDNEAFRMEASKLRDEIERLRNEVSKLRYELARERRTREEFEARVDGEMHARERRASQRLSQAERAVDVLASEDADALMEIRSAGEAAVRKDQLASDARESKRVRAEAAEHEELLEDEE